MKHKSEENFWNNHYNTFKVSKPTQFAMFVSTLVSKSDQVIELGCGNGRDSLTLSRNAGQYLGIDKSIQAIKRTNQIYSVSKTANYSLSFIENDFLYFRELEILNPSLCFFIYSRFTLHSVAEEEEDFLLKEIGSIGQRVRFAFEVRTIHDPWFGIGEEVARNAYYSTHFRRFIDPRELVAKIRKIAEIEFIALGRGLAKFHKEDPKVLRIIAKTN